MSRFSLSLFAVLLATLLAADSTAQVPTTLNYQGRLLENTADQDAADGTVDIVFSLWTEATGGVQLWSEAWTGVPLSNGIFSVLLGSNGSPFDPAAFYEDQTLFLQLQVEGETLSPRQSLGSTPFAFADEPENELQDLRLQGNELTLTSDSTPVDLSPYLDDTDDQDLSLSGTSLILENDPTSVDLSPFLDNTDVQTLSLSGDTLTISGSGSSVNLASATEFSQLSGRVSAVEAALTRTVFVTSTTITGGAMGGLDGGDAICSTLAANAGLDGVFLAWLSDDTASPASRFDRLGSFENVSGARVANDWADLVDGTLDNAIDQDETGTPVGGDPRTWTGTAADGTAATARCAEWSDDSATGQSGDLSSTTASWTAANGADDCAEAGRLYCVEQVVLGLDDQQLSLDGDQLVLTSTDGVDRIDLSPYLDAVDNQVLSLLGNTLQLTSDDGTDSVDLSPYLDDVDNQVLSISGNTLQLTSDDGTDSVDLSAYLDAVDNQVLSISGNTLRLTSDDGTDTVNLATYLDNTDNQVLSLSGNTLQLTSDDGTDSVNLAAFLDNTDNQQLSISGNTLRLTSDDGTDTVNLAGYLDNTDSQNINSVLANGTDANNRDLTNLDDVDIDKLTIDDNFECDADSANCIESSHIERDTILGNDITDRIFIVWIDCNGNCNDQSMREACDDIEELRGLDFEVELMGVSCVYDVPSTTGNGFVDCPSNTAGSNDNECRAFELRTLGDLPCINGDGTDVIVTCYETDIAK